MDIKSIIKCKHLSIYINIKYDIGCTFMDKKVKLILPLWARNSNQICEIEVLKLTPFDELCQLLIFSGQRINLVIFEERDFFVQSKKIAATKVATNNLCLNQTQNCSIPEKDDQTKLQAAIANFLFLFQNWYVKSNKFSNPNIFT